MSEWGECVRRLKSSNDYSDPVAGKGLFLIRRGISRFHADFVPKLGVSQGSPHGYQCVDVSWCWDLEKLGIKWVLL